MSTIDDRAREIYDFLFERQGERFTMSQLCEQLHLSPGAKTTAAIRRARDLAANDGLHFPPAVPQNSYTYTVTAVPLEAIAPAMQMSAIARGVERRAQIGYDFAEQGAAQLPPQVRIAIAARQEVVRGAAHSMKVIDDLVVQLAKVMADEARESNGAGAESGGGSTV